MLAEPQTKAVRCSLKIASKSISGARPENQDRVAHFDSDFGHVFLMADGMGGYRGGALASSLVTSRLPEILRSRPASMPAQFALLESIHEVNRLILEEGAAGGEAVDGMGSTLAALLVRATEDGSLAIGAHVGDSRIYLLRGQRLFRVTRDHTLVESLVESGVLTQEQAFDPSPCRPPDARPWP